MNTSINIFTYANGTVIFYTHNWHYLKNLVESDMRHIQGFFKHRSKRSYRFTLIKETLSHITVLILKKNLYRNL